MSYLPISTLTYGEAQEVADALRHGTPLSTLPGVTAVLTNAMYRIATLEQQVAMLMRANAVGVKEQK